jgi:hypothetical protein
MPEPISERDALAAPSATSAIRHGSSPIISMSAKQSS